jgi:hypothetical protein
MSAAPTTAYRYLTHSEPKCGIVGTIVDVHAVTRDDANLMILDVQERFYGSHARQDGVNFEWNVRDRNGFPLVSATTTPEGTTYHQGR